MMNYLTLLFGGNSNRSIGSGLSATDKKRLGLAAKAHLKWLDVSYNSNDVYGVYSARDAADSISKEDVDVVSAEIVKKVVDKLGYDGFQISLVSGKIFAGNNRFQIIGDPATFAGEGARPGGWIVRDYGSSKDFNKKIKLQKDFKTPVQAVRYINSQLKKKK